MDAAVVHTLGRPPRCEQFREPVAGDNEVIVDVDAAAIKPVDKPLASRALCQSARSPICLGTCAARSY